MSRLSLKTLKLKKLPYGRFTYQVLLGRNIHNIVQCESNAGEIEKMRDLLRNTCVGHYRLDYELNWRSKRVYTHLYLSNPMDLALIKLVHSDKIHKIYKIKLLDA